MLSMYAKLFSRIAQSSLMEQPVSTRYCFMMLLAIADPNGDVIGTDIAIARSINLPLDEFKECLSALLAPDPDSNSQAEEGRRIIPSENGRGYRLVNYTAYRAIKTTDEKREYMRNYMRDRRKSLKPSGVTDVNFCKNELSDVTHTEGEEEAELETEEKPKRKRAAAAVLPFPENWTPERKQAMQSWIDYKRERGAGYKPTGWKALCSKLEPYSDAKIVQCVSDSMANNWNGLFPEKTTHAKHSAIGPNHGSANQAAIDEYK
jgi:hypothetical protein